jgi:hypothetical protein
VDTPEAELVDESTFESQFSPDSDSVYSTQASVLSLHSSACSDGLNYGPSLPSSPHKVQRKFHLIYGKMVCNVPEVSLYEEL